MFWRKISGLPKDPEFPFDMKELGYFINEHDEIRSIEDHDKYFKFFINRNQRWNDRQRFSMNTIIRRVVVSRIEEQGLNKVKLPLGISDLSAPNLDIFVSANIEKATRVVLIFGETVQEFCILAHRCVGGKGGINKGSMVSIVSALLKQHASTTDKSPPGIILANLGELFWWPEGKRALTHSGFNSVPMKSSAHKGQLFDEEKNTIPGSRTPHEHVAYIFEKVVPHFVNTKAGLQILGVGDGGDTVEEYLDSAPIWKQWEQRIKCFANVGGVYSVEAIKCEGLKTFLREKARNYTNCEKPAGTVLSGPDGNPETATFTHQGCPVFSSGESQHTELELIACYDLVLDWFQEVGRTDNYKNPEFEVLFHDPKLEGGVDWSDWKPGPEDGVGEMPTVEANTIAPFCAEPGNTAATSDANPALETTAKENPAPSTYHTLNLRGGSGGFKDPSRRIS
ncbi:Arb2 domain-containing protein [Xylariomycetidae sp. FL2044]|nr:Arb2 domain-containing protein [Xylariomycetidae sp. FL2044]